MKKLFKFLLVMLPLFSLWLVFRYRKGPNYYKYRQCISTFRSEHYNEKNTKYILKSIGVQYHSVGKYSIYMENDTPLTTNETKMSEVMILARIPDVGYQFIDTESAYIVFFFDVRGNLVKFHSESRFYGL